MERGSSNEVSATDAQATARDCGSSSGEMERLALLGGNEPRLLEALLQHNPEGIMLFDASGNLLLQNSASERIWEGTASSKEPPGSQRYRALLLDGRTLSIEEWMKSCCLAARQTLALEELQVQRLDGSHATLLASATPITDAAGELSSGLLVFSDITRLKELEAASRQRAERTQRIQALTSALAAALSFHEIAERVIDHGVALVGARNGALWIVDEQGNEAGMLRHFGYSEDAVKNFSTLPLDGPSPLADAMRRREPVFIESLDDYARRYPASEARTRSAQYAMIAFACLPLVAADQAIGGLAFTFDGPRNFDDDERSALCLIAAHCAQGLHRARVYEAEQQVRSQVGLLYTLLDAVSRAISLDDVYEPALWAVERGLRVQRSAILLYESDGLMRFKASHGLSDTYRKAVEGHSPWPRNVKNPRPIMISDCETDDSMRDFREILRVEGIRGLIFVPLYHQKLLGKFMIYSNEPRVFTAEEINLAETIARQVAQAVARKLSEAEIAHLYVEAQDARTAAETASRMKDEFLAVVSHELRTPLAAISGWAAVLKGERRNDPAALTKGIDVIDRNAKMQAKIIEDILDVSRIVTGKLRLDPKPVSLANVVSEALDSVRTSAHAKGIDLIFQTPEEPHAVIGDSERLRQIVWNLLSNAIKFTPEGGRVEISLARDAGMTMLRVKDTGKGIDAAFLPHVFERFRQADSSTTRTHSGLGLGLAIVRHLCELHGGQVKAESDGLGKGALFTVGFPVKAVFVGHEPELHREQKTAPEQVGLERGMADLTGIRVLLVDDEPDARELLKEVLGLFGATVEVAESVEDALSKAAQFAPHVVVSDIGMPEQDGYALIRRLRELQSEVSRVPAIALTAYARPDDAKRVLRAGFQYHLPKPTEPVTLAAAIAAVHHAR